MGGLASPLTVTANTTYHLFVIYNPTTQITDAGFDININATNLLATATGYTKYRRVGSFLTDNSANLQPFKALEKAGGEILIKYTSPIQDLTESTLQPTTYTNLPITIPTDINLIPDMAFNLRNNNGNTNEWVLVQDTYTSDIRAVSGRDNQNLCYPTNVITNTGSIAYKFLAGGAAISGLSVFINGYTDQRL